MSAGNTRGFGPGPVFVYEWITSSRRWQAYAWRSLFVLGLMAALLVMGISRGPDVIVATTSVLRALAQLGEGFFVAVIGTQLTLVLLAAPAATAGAICLDRSRGTLTHLLVTDLTDREIVLGKLAARPGTDLDPGRRHDAGHGAAHAAGRGRSRRPPRRIRRDARRRGARLHAGPGVLAPGPPDARGAAGHLRRVGRLAAEHDHARRDQPNHGRVAPRTAPNGQPVPAGLRPLLATEVGGLARLCRFPRRHLGDLRHPGPARGPDHAPRLHAGGRRAAGAATAARRGHRHLHEGPGVPVIRMARDEADPRAVGALAGLQSGLLARMASQPAAPLGDGSSWPYSWRWR